MARIATTHIPLAASATYTEAVDSTPGDGIVGAVFSSHAGTLFIEQSLDGTTYPVSTQYVISANVAKTFVEPVYLPKCQVRFVNGATAQTKFDSIARAVSASYSS